MHAERLVVLGRMATKVAHDIKNPLNAIQGAAHHLEHASAHHVTTSRGPRDEALRNSATPTVGSGSRMQIGDGKSEIRNPKSEIRNFAALHPVSCK